MQPVMGDVIASLGRGCRDLRPVVVETPALVFYTPGCRRGWSYLIPVESIRRSRARPVSPEASHASARVLYRSLFGGWSLICTSRRRTTPFGLPDLLSAPAIGRRVFGATAIRIRSGCWLRVTRPSV